MSSVGARTGGCRRWLRAVPPGIVEGQAQAEADAGLDLPHPLEHLLGGEQVDAAELVVLAPVPPRRAGRALLPPLRHGLFSFWSQPSATGCQRCLYRPVGLHSWAQGTACARRSVIEILRPGAGRSQP